MLSEALWTPVRVDQHVHPRRRAAVVAPRAS